MRTIATLAIGVAVWATLLPLDCAHAQATAPTPTWTRPQCDDIIKTGEEAGADGLPVRLALIDRLRDLVRQAERERDLDERANLENERIRTCESLFQVIARDFAQGATAPTRSDPAWRIAGQALDLETVRAMAQGSVGVQATLQALLPQDDEYRALRDALVAESAETKSAANAGREQALRAAMERWRWLPHIWPDRYVIVDTAFFDAHLVQSGQTLDRWNVVVGARRSPTPSFSASITAVTLNPSWTPPGEIARAEIVPMLRRNPTAAAALGYQAIDAAGEAIEADWRQRPFPYRIVQAPGPNNALGAVKLEMANPFAVYLHDTPSKALFARPERAFSHGCVRVEDPRRLALALIARPEIDAAALDALIAGGATQTIALDQPIPIFVLYRTVRSDEAGALEFAKDIYGRDRRLVAALKAQAITAAQPHLGSVTECAAL